MDVIWIGREHKIVNCRDTWVGRTIISRIGPSQYWVLNFDDLKKGISKIS
jgi:hypothetical protein